ncbi:hypothetical protein AKJ09_02114 [Labilithrix luteola]|uniref:Uncharacterized protein n=2 Tax=Labilithrix luteola TaxID=1391654 RepID=A0A0K1PPI2_9BACT|nr:hypothetical protein AKJ09_02114 [Labilithrix luteola]
MTIHFSPKSIWIWCPGAVSKRTVCSLCSPFLLPMWRESLQRSQWHILASDAQLACDTFLAPPQRVQRADLPNDLAKQDRFDEAPDGRAVTTTETASRFRPCLKA